MSVTFIAENAPAAARADLWQQVVDDAMVPLRRRHDPAEDFRASLLTGEIGALQVTELTTPAGECFRPARLVRPIDAGRYQIEVLDRGEVLVEQEGRQIRQGPGDIVLLDPSRPVSYRHSATCHVAVLFPRAMLPLRPSDLAPHIPVRVPADQATGALASTLARQLPRHLDDYRAAEAVRLGTSVVDLLAAAVAAQLDRDRDLPAETRQAALLRQVYAFIDAHLGDPALSPAMVAAAHHISIRYLHRLFETEDVTAADWIRRRRLDRCRRDLLDPAQRARPVNAIAARWGMPNAAHFGRAFKSAYGLPPAEYRTLSGM